MVEHIARRAGATQRTYDDIPLGKDAVLAGFYSYGEICPHGAATKCELHNQTMTITTFSER